MIRCHLGAVTVTGVEGYLVISSPNPDRWESRAFRTDDLDAAARHAYDLDTRGRNVYLRASLVGAPPGSGRGTAEDTSALVALVVDLDIDGPGHAPSTNGRLPLPPDLDVGLAIFRELPPPTLTIHTGGGAHLWWVLDEPVTEDPKATADVWGARVVEAGRRAGFHVDRPDVCRVLRVAGTHRRKTGVPVNLVEIVR
jgi:hypothetical protein